MKKLYLLSTMMLLVIAAMLPHHLTAQVSVWDGTYAPWTNGTGTESDPFLIENAQQLAYLANRVNNGLDAGGGHVSNHDLHYKLMTDVNLNGFQWTPIGYWNSTTNYYSFGGHFDGNNHIVYPYTMLDSNSNVVFVENFDNGFPSTWITIDADGDGFNWNVVGNIVGHGNTGNCISSHSYLNNVALTPNNWLITPAISIPNGFYGLSFWVSAEDQNYAAEHYGVYITTSDDYTNTNNYTLLFEETINANGGNRQGAWKRKSYWLGQYAGQNVHIAFRHFNCSDMFCINIDDIVVDNSALSYDPYNHSSSNRTGFFGYTDGGRIENLKLQGPIFLINYSEYYGSIVGYANETTIKNCCSYGGNVVLSNNTYAGGLIGCATGNSSIVNSYNSTSINSSSTWCLGGIVGLCNNSALNIINTYNSGDIISNSNNTGGIIGRNNNATLNITNSYNTGSLSPYNSGGIVGYNGGQSNVVNCYFLSTCNGNNNYGGSPMSADVMQTAEFVDMLNNGSCAWEQDVIPYVNDGYPLLTMIVQDAATDPTTDLTANSAMLHGSVSVEHANITSKGFEYRMQGDSTFTSISITGDDDEFSYLLNGLTPNTAYEYRTFVNVAECPYTSYGDIQPFEVSWLNADTILIYDADMLQWVSDRCNSGTTFEGKYIKLMNNIVLPLNQPNNMTSIGSYPNHPFKGTFDGNGMLISNLYIDHPNTEYQGFFGYTLDANLYEVGLVNITASGRNYTGGMVAYASNTYMRDCYVSGGSLFALSYCGGLVGYQNQGTNSIISGCYNTCTVSGNHYVGGLVGFSNYATVRNSYVAANVTGQGNGIGAIIGGANEVLMYNCFFSSSITGQTSAIGENNFKDDEGLTNEQMQDPAFVATLNQGLVVPVWKSDYETPINNGFPILIWQYSDVETCDAPINPNAVVNGTSATLSWSGGGNASYYVVEYGVVGGETHSENTSNHQLTLHNLQYTNYFWRVKSVCSFGESNFVNGNNITVGIANHDGFNFKVYPNPTSNIVNVEFGMGNGELGDVKIQLYDVYGKLLDATNVVGANDYSPMPQATAQIDLSRYANGVYVLKAVANGKTIGVRKVVRQ